MATKKYFTHIYHLCTKDIIMATEIFVLFTDLIFFPAVITSRKQLINVQGPATMAILVHGQTGSMNADQLPLLNNQLLDQIPLIDVCSMN